MWVRSLGQDDGEQKELLDALREKTGEDVFVASHMAAQVGETGDLGVHAVIDVDARAERCGRPCG